MVENIVRDSPEAGIGLVLGILVGLWTASGYVGAFIRASNEIHDADEDRPFWKLRPLQTPAHPGDLRDPRRWS